MSTWTQVPSGASTFHEAMSSPAATWDSYSGEVHVATSNDVVLPVCGSAKSTVSTGLPIRMPARSPSVATVPAASPDAQCSAVSHAKKSTPSSTGVSDVVPRSATAAPETNTVDVAARPAANTDLRDMEPLISYSSK